MINGSEIRNLGDIKWEAVEDRSPGKGTGRHIAQFILKPRNGESRIEMPDYLLNN